MHTNFDDLRFATANRRAGISDTFVVILHKYDCLAREIFSSRQMFRLEESIDCFR